MPGKAESLSLQLPTDIDAGSEKSHDSPLALSYLCKPGGGDGVPFRKWERLNPLKEIPSAGK